MQITEEQVEKIAHLGRLGISETESQEATDRFKGILEAFAVIASLKADGSPEVFLPKNRHQLRKDEVLPSLGQVNALSNAPQAHEGHFRVPAVL